MSETTSCPTCGQPWPEPNGRVCFLCHKQMGLHDKWHIVGSTVQHKDCKNPTLEGPVISARATLTLALPLTIPEPTE